ncbi:MAG: hypothetical protein NTZ09_10510 [Candidatus Hydrogenedentes bacterium]|nr:hypothetical protein [Candidatus Hydrogenedentota bacterium]
MTGAPVFQLLGLAYLAVGLGILINPKFYKRMIDQMLDSPALIYLSGFMALAVGYLLIVFYSTWGVNLRLILTVIGWIALFKGLSAIVLPQLLIKISRIFIRSGKTVIGAGLIMTALGVVMLYIGFFAAR